MKALIIASIIMALVAGAAYGNSLPPTPDWFEIESIDMHYEH